MNIQFYEIEMDLFNMFVNITGELTVCGFKQLLKSLKFKTHEDSSEVLVSIRSNTLSVYVQVR